MLEIISNGRSKNVPVWVNDKPATIEDLIEVLKNYTLDPMFEKYGNFINYNPQWIITEAKDKYKNCVKIFGNFQNISHGFNIITDDKNIINSLEIVIKNNIQSKEYQEARKNYIQKENHNRKIRNDFNTGKINLKEMYQSMI